MKLLDRYIARHYLTNVVVLFVILFSFILTVDVSLNIDRFVNLAEKMASTPSPAPPPVSPPVPPSASPTETSAGPTGDVLLVSQAPAVPAKPGAIRTGLVTVLLILDLWWPRFLQLFNFMLGLVLVGAMGFTCSQMVRHRELVAVLSSGQSMYRVARPLLLVALALTAVQVVNQELVLPEIAPLLTRDHPDAGKRNLGSARVPLTSDADGRLFYARLFDADTSSIEGLYVWERDENGLATRRITADHARWRDGGWDLIEGVAMDRSGGSAAVDRIETDLDPTTLTMLRHRQYAQSLSWRQLSRMAHRRGHIDDQSRRRLDRTRFGRISITISNLLALVISMSFFLTRAPVNMVIQSLKCSPVAIVALMGGVLGASASIPGLPASVGAFLPVMVLAPVAVARISSVKT